MPDKPKREGIMLCYPTEKSRILRLGDRFFLEPKLRGDRCRIEWFHNEPVLLTSYGNEFTFLDHIKEAIKETFKTFHIPLDGEIYKHGWSQERINSTALPTKNKHPETHLLEYHIFDYQSTDESQFQRTSVLGSLNKDGRFQKPLVKVSTEIADIDTWEQRCLEYIDEGYEGVVLKHPIALYTKKRSVYWLKFKPTEQDDYTIIEVLEGTGWAEGMVGSFVVQGDDGVVFSVGTGPALTKKKRKEYWKIREEIVGQPLTVKHEKIRTTRGIPVCTVAITLK